MVTLQELNYFKCYVIYQIRDKVFHQIFNTEKRVENTDAQRSIFDEIRGVWKCDETLSRVFDVSSKSKLKLRNTRRNKVVEIVCY